MMTPPRIVNGLNEIAAGHDVLVCDVWGVLHDGVRARPGAVEALRRFRAEAGPVVLLSNAPRPPSALVEQFKGFGVPPDCYDAIVTSGLATHEALAREAEGGRLPLFHLGPERDRGLFEGLAIDFVAPEAARLVVCTGPFDDNTETPDDYRDMLARFARLDLAMLCANPDLVVQRGEKLVYCAGALARAYEAAGGRAVYFGKPFAPIYEVVRSSAARLAGREPQRPLAVGDGLETDIRGANNVGIEALFIVDGVHRAEVGSVSAVSVARACARAGVHAKAAMFDLVW